MSVDSFSWEIEQEGYKFATLIAVNHEPTQHRVLVSRASGEQFNTRRQVLPESSALWREFAGLELTEKAIEAFASEHGQLFLKVQNPTAIGMLAIQDNDSNMPEQYPAFLSTGDTFDVWRENILKMKRLSQIWDLLKDTKISELQRTKQLKRHLAQTNRDENLWAFFSRPEIFKLYENGLQNPNRQSVESIWTDDDFYQEFPLPRFENPKLKDAVQNLISLEVNERLERVRPKLLWDMSKPLSKHLDLMLVPTNLADALWLQFAQAVTRDTKYVQCKREKCKKWFALVNRNSEKKDYCDNACKQAAFRERKASKKSV